MIVLLLLCYAIGRESRLPHIPLTCPFPCRGQLLLEVPLGLKQEAAPKVRKLPVDRAPATPLVEIHRGEGGGGLNHFSMIRPDGVGVIWPGFVMPAPPALQHVGRRQPPF